MTIIAYYDGMLIADRKSIIRDDSCHAEIVTEETKIFTSPCGRYACGVVGRVKTQKEMDLIIPALAEKILDPKPNIEFSDDVKRVMANEHTGYVFISRSQIAVFTHAEMRFIPNGVPVFTGSGGYLAKGHFLSGKSLLKSVEFAVGIDNLCGKNLDKINCKPLFKKDIAMAKRKAT